MEEKAIQLRSKLEEEEFFKEWTEGTGEEYIHVSTSEQSTSGLGEQEIFSQLKRTEEEPMLVESEH